MERIRLRPSSTSDDRSVPSELHRQVQAKFDALYRSTPNPMAALSGGDAKRGGLISTSSQPQQLNKQHHISIQSRLRPQQSLTGVSRVVRSNEQRNIPDGNLVTKLNANDMRKLSKHEIGGSIETRSLGSPSYDPDNFVESSRVLHGNSDVPISRSFAGDITSALKEKEDVDDMTSNHKVHTTDGANITAVTAAQRAPSSVMSASDKTFKRGTFKCQVDDSVKHSLIHSRNESAVSSNSDMMKTGKSDRVDSNGNAKSIDVGNRSPVTEGTNSVTRTNNRVKICQQVSTGRVIKTTLDHGSEMQVKEAKKLKSAKKRLQVENISSMVGSAHSNVDTQSRENGSEEDVGMNNLQGIAGHNNILYQSNSIREASARDTRMEKIGAISSEIDDTSSPNMKTTRSGDSSKVAEKKISTRATRRKNKDVNMFVETVSTLREVKEGIPLVDSHRPATSSSGDAFLEGPTSQTSLSAQPSVSATKAKGNVEKNREIDAESPPRNRRKRNRSNLKVVERSRTVTTIPKANVTSLRNCEVVSSTINSPQQLKDGGCSQSDITKLTNDDREPVGHEEAMKPSSNTRLRAAGRKSTTYGIQLKIINDEVAKVINSSPPLNENRCCEADAVKLTDYVHESIEHGIVSRSSSSKKTRGAGCDSSTNADSTQVTIDDEKMQEKSLGLAVASSQEPVDKSYNKPTSTPHHINNKKGNSEKGKTLFSKGNAFHTPQNACFKVKSKSEQKYDRDHRSSSFRNVESERSLSAEGKYSHQKRGRKRGLGGSNSLSVLHLLPSPMNVRSAVSSPLKFDSNTKGKRSIDDIVSEPLINNTGHCTELSQRSSEREGKVKNVRGASSGLVFVNLAKGNKEEKLRGDDSREKVDLPTGEGADSDSKKGNEHKLIVKVKEKSVKKKSLRRTKKSAHSSVESADPKNHFTSRDLKTNKSCDAAEIVSHQANVDELVEWSTDEVKILKSVHRKCPVTAVDFWGNVTFEFNYQMKKKAQNYKERSPQECQSQWFKVSVWSAFSCRLIMLMICRLKAFESVKNSSLNRRPTKKKKLDDKVETGDNYYYSCCPVHIYLFMIALDVHGDDNKHDNKLMEYDAPPAPLGKRRKTRQTKAQLQVKCSHIGEECPRHNLT